jgi:hypothetical protein
MVRWSGEEACRVWPMGRIGRMRIRGGSTRRWRRRPARCASRSAFSSAARTWGPVRSRCRSSPEVAQGSDIEVDLTRGPLSN